MLLHSSQMLHRKTLCLSAGFFSYHSVRWSSWGSLLLCRHHQRGRRRLRCVDYVSYRRLSVCHIRTDFTAMPFQAIPSLCRHTVILEFFFCIAYSIPSRGMTKFIDILLLSYTHTWKMKCLHKIFCSRLIWCQQTNFQKFKNTFNSIILNKIPKVE